MPFRTIKQWPSKSLSKVADLASPSDIKEVSTDLIDTLKVIPGAGLAAPQIGISKRVLVIDTSRFKCENPDAEKGDANFWVVANPQISNKFGEWKWQEACLSVPLVKCMVTRSAVLTLEYDDINGERNKLDLEAPLSLALQHEADHLDGKTILDRVSKFTSNIYKRKIRKSILKSIRQQRELEKGDELNIGRPKKKSHLSNQERKKRKKNRLKNLRKK
jgi:peptide deformylase